MTALQLEHKLIGEREIARSEISYSYVDGERSPRTELRSTRQQTEQAVLPSEMMQLPDCTGYLKVATRPHWMRVSFDYLRFKTVTEAWLPDDRRTRVRAPRNPITSSTPP